MNKYEKLVKVIDSCETFAQLKTAEKYCKLFTQSEKSDCGFLDTYLTIKCRALAKGIIENV